MHHRTLLKEAIAEYRNQSKDKQFKPFNDTYAPRAYIDRGIFKAIKMDRIKEYLEENGNRCVFVAHRGGTTPLVYAIRLHKIEAVQALLNAGANPNLRIDEPGNNATPLILAVQGGCEINLIRMLIDAGAASSYDAIDWSSNKKTALEIAQKKNLSADIIQLLSDLPHLYPIMRQYNLSSLQAQALKKPNVMAWILQASQLITRYVPMDIFLIVSMNVLDLSFDDTLAVMDAVLTQFNKKYGSEQALWGIISAIVFKDGFWLAKEENSQIQPEIAFIRAVMRQEGELKDLLDKIPRQIDFTKQTCHPHTQQFLKALSEALTKDNIYPDSYNMTKLIDFQEKVIKPYERKIAEDAYLIITNMFSKLPEDFFQPHFTYFSPIKSDEKKSRPEFIDLLKNIMGMKSSHEKIIFSLKKLLNEPHLITNPYVKTFYDALCQTVQGDNNALKSFYEHTVEPYLSFIDKTKQIIESCIFVEDFWEERKKDKSEGMVSSSIEQIRGFLKGQLSQDLQFFSLREMFNLNQKLMQDTKADTAHAAQSKSNRHSYIEYTLFMKRIDIDERMDVREYKQQRNDKLIFFQALRSALYDNDDTALIAFYENKIKPYERGYQLNELR